MADLYVPEREPVTEPDRRVTRPWLMLAQGLVSGLGQVAIDVAALQAAVALLQSAVATLQGQMAIVLGWGLWQPYTPQWVSTGTQPTPGASTFTGSYAVVGNTVFVKGRIVLGAGFSFGTGIHGLTLPFASQNGLDVFCVNRYTDSGGTGSYLGIGTLGSIGGQPAISWFTGASPIAQVTATVPFTWDVGDFVSFSIQYQRP